MLGNWGIQNTAKFLGEPMGVWGCHSHTRPSLSASRYQAYSGSTLFTYGPNPCDFARLQLENRGSSPVEPPDAPIVAGVVPDFETLAYETEMFFFPQSLVRSF